MKVSLFDFFTLGTKEYLGRVVSEETSDALLCNYVFVAYRPVIFWLRFLFHEKKTTHQILGNMISDVI